ncbi:MAG: hypothetical protein RQ847_11950 [Wenzhouxiangellaceae bacterium]|nr:hypothetical protein [Wenzhouxiangellaceae bacterium]
MNTSPAKIGSGALAMLFVFGLAIPAHAGTGDQHAHETGEGLELQLDNGARWVTDESLRTGMTEIREAFERKLPRFRAGTLEQQDYAELAGTVDKQLNFMFNNCDLPPAADAQLHKLLASISGAAAALREEERAPKGMRSLHRALEAYGTHFDHPGWSVESGSGSN